jgi:hypothetical protein
MERSEQTQLFINKAITTHGSRYDYSRSEYKDWRIKIDIRCSEHGIFSQRPSSHISGKGCPTCGNLSRSKSNTCNTDQFVEKAIKVHGNRYDYSKVKYIDLETKIIIGCSIHGDFLQTPHGHLRGRVCKKCTMKKLQESVKHTSFEFINKAISVHGNRYDYSKSVYIDAHSKLKIICPTHGGFYQTSNDHLSGCGCSKCGYIKVGVKRTLTQEKFIKKAIKVYGEDKYEYTKTRYSNALTDVIVTCKVHGDFKQNAHNFLQGHGCQICMTSYGELAIRNWLFENKINFAMQYKFKELRAKRCLRFDFYIPDINTLIEYDGEQHYRPVQFNGISIDKAVKIHKKAQHRDVLKNKFCEENNIPLIRIGYQEFKNIPNILSSKVAVTIK